eukprot:TRINITY_DN26706_c0_g2_i1.p1 TRINITY_DN26706_c0_g2~~TRINITY_DN26706_c0_g2_i1.p1  ORF type:complete len:731 (-),score=151.33 TRINITY_DN26706_c0_g2_i1:49-2130(-)
MSPRRGAVFHGSLASIAAEYARLEAENVSLKAHLRDLVQSEGTAKDFESTTAAPDEVSALPEGADDASHWLARYDTTWNAATVQPEGPSASEGAHALHDEELAPQRPEKVLAEDALHATGPFEPPGRGSNMEDPAARVQHQKMQEADEIHRRAVFLNASDMREQVRKEFHQKKASAQDHYKTTGPFQAIARHQLFESLALGTIAANSIWIAIDTDHNKAELLLDAHWTFMIGEQIFCFIFFAELFIRYMAYVSTTQAFMDFWFLFDAILVAAMVTEAWILTIVTTAMSRDAGQASILGKASVLRVARSLRLLRVARMARLLRKMPELMTLMKGLVGGLRSVVVTLMLLTIMTYVFAIAFTQLMRDTAVGLDHFNSVVASMQTLWVHCALLDGVSVLMDVVEKESLVGVFLLDLFIVVSALFVMNMLIGVLCNVVICVGTADKEEFMMNYAKMKLQRLYHKDLTKTFTKADYLKMLKKDLTADIMKDLGVDTCGLVEYADVIFSDGGSEEVSKQELTFPEFMNAIMQLNGNGQALVRDIVDLRKFVHFHSAKQKQDIDKKLDKMCDRMTSLLATYTESVAELMEKATDVSKRVQKDMEKGMKKNVHDMSQNITKHLALVSDVLYAHPEIRPPTPYNTLSTPRYENGHFMLDSDGLGHGAYVDADPMPPFDIPPVEDLSLILHDVSPQSVGTATM